ncbi:MAG TPA: glutamate synthase subunit beta [Candidatus Pullichristensenella excrementigallinarum]|uniref:Glutamate synthase subunit beta n=1 Tax=Candidatus Pullichristensenella excrementigallinarum TaxID=2840907 RepID=A0A9D1ICT2_9FIRM|nr:glutamate synthase subunit beta [Candidatus Pullichristensenella excrementigallinarum]
MGKATGFLEFPRVEDPFRPVAERLRDFAYLHTSLPKGERMEQAARCMNCGVPFCQSDYGCPLHNLIPEWNDLLYRGQFEEALKRLLKTASFPEFTGRVCPQLCEKACMLSENATTNRDNELFLIEEGFRNGWVTPRIPARRSDKTVAVVGSGPSGLAAADMLNRFGHRVTVVERADRPGGLLMYGIPNMKLPKNIVARRIGVMKAEGVEFRLNTPGDAGLLKDFDAVVLCGGARRARRLNVPGEDARGVVMAVDFLTEATRAVLDAGQSAVSALNKDVIVVGGGDTGNDCVGTCLRQGCRSVVQLELLSAPPASRIKSNPWPEWPRVLRTDYGQIEAIRVQGVDPRQFETTVERVVADGGGNVCAVDVVKVARDAEGRISPVEGTRRTLPCQLLLIAAGFIGCEEKTAEQFQIALNRRGVPEIFAGTHQLSQGLFVAGDMRNGQSLVVRAIADGRAAALEVHQYLTGSARLEP